MNPNTKRRTNRLQFASLLRGIVVIAFLSLTGLSYVYLKHQMYVCGSQRQSLEQELRELISENNVMETQIARLTSHAALQRKLDEGFLKLIPINNQTIVRVRTQDSNRWVANDTANGDQLQTVSHQRGRRP